MPVFGSKRIDAISVAFTEVSIKDAGKTRTRDEFCTEKPAVLENPGEAEAVREKVSSPSVYGDASTGP